MMAHIPASSTRMEHQLRRTARAATTDEVKELRREANALKSLSSHGAFGVKNR